MNFEFLSKNKQHIYSALIKRTMVYTYQDINVYYRFIGTESASPILLLHGWGCDGDIFDRVVEAFPEKSFLSIDFPPFGKSCQTPVNWNIFSYANMVISLCEHLHIKRCDLLAHSFGGRVAILISALNEKLVNSCVLCGCAGLKPKRGIGYHFKVLNYKMRKKLGLNTSKYGSNDYKMLSDDMKKVFNEVVNQDLKDYCPLIKAPCLIIFGQKDRETPVYMAKKLHKKITNSHLCILPDAGHFAFIDSQLSFTRELSLFWEEFSL